MSFISIEAEEYILKIRGDNFLEFIVKENAVLTVETITEAKRILQEYRPGVKYYVLSEGFGFFTITKEARELSATAEFSSHMAAVAFHTNNPSLVFLGELYNNLNKPAVPTRVFHSRYSAMEWLEGKMIESAPALERRRTGTI